MALGNLGEEMMEEERPDSSCYRHPGKVRAGALFSRVVGCWSELACCRGPAECPVPSAQCPGLSRSHPPSAPCLVSGQESPVPAESASLLAPVTRAVCVCVIPSSCGFSSLSPFMGWALSQGYFIWRPWDPGFPSMDELQRLC